MKRIGKRLLSLALAAFLCLTVPAQALTAAEIPGEPVQTDVEGQKVPESADAAGQEASEPTDTYGQDVSEPADADDMVSDSDPAVNEDVQPDENNQYPTADGGEEMTEVVDVSGLLYQEGGAGTPSAAAYGIAAYAVSSREELKAEIVQTLKAGGESLDISRYGITKEDLAEVSVIYSEAVNENPSLFYVDKGFSYSYNSTMILQLGFKYDDVTDAQKQAFEKKANEAVALVTDEMSETEKALVLHDYLAQHCAYANRELLDNTLSSVPHVYDAYGALVNGKAVCEGYSLAYVELLKRAGITSYVCSSDSMNHAWNVVLIDGNWYHADVTWDDPVWNREGRVRHEYFLLSDTEMGNRKHSGWTESVVCDSAKYDSYWWRNVDSRIVQVGHEDYIYVDTGSINFSLVRRTNGTESEVYESSATWPVGDGSGKIWYAQAFLSRQGDSIYFNDNLNIWSMDLAGSEAKTVYTYDGGSGYIYGAMVYEDGTARLNIDTTPNRDKDDYISVSVFVNPIRVTAVTLDQTSVSLKEGETLKLTATVVPDNADNQEVRWSSDNSTVATVAADGTVTAWKAGSATVTVTTADGAKTASCTVTVTRAAEPTTAPTAQPTAAPTAAPTAQPTAAPTAAPTTQPTAVPTAAPTAQPTAAPTAAPTAQPTAAPTAAPTTQPTAAPTAAPTTQPTAVPTAAPTAQPTAAPTAAPTAQPTAVPTTAPTTQPTAVPTTQPTAVPTTQPTMAPTTQPTAVPTTQPTAVPTTAPTTQPTAAPTAAPTTQPTAVPTTQPTMGPTAAPTPVPDTNDEKVDKAVQKLDKAKEEITQEKIPETVKQIFNELKGALSGSNGEKQEKLAETVVKSLGSLTELEEKLTAENGRKVTVDDTAVAPTVEIRNAEFNVSPGQEGKIVIENDAAKEKPADLNVGSVAVFSFSMLIKTPEGVWVKQSGMEFTVPLYITLDVPAGIDTSNGVLIFHIADGSNVWEAQGEGILSADGKKVSFVAGSFSSYAVAAKAGTEAPAPDDDDDDDDMDSDTGSEQKTVAPKTGDYMNNAAVASFLILAMAGIGTAVVVRRRRESE